MSMIQYYLAVDPSDGQRLVASPKQILPFLQAVDESYKSWGNRFIEIDKAWHGIHFLLTGNPDECDHPLSTVIFGGTECGDDVGYGPARIQTLEEVKIVHDLIKGITEAELATKFSVDDFRTKEIYPTGWGEGDHGYLTGYFAEVQKFYAMASAKGYWVIKFLS